MRQKLAGTAKCNSIFMIPTPRAWSLWNSSRRKRPAAIPSQARILTHSVVNAPTRVTHGRYLWIIFRRNKGKSRKRYGADRSALVKTTAFSKTAWLGKERYSSHFAGAFAQSRQITAQA